MALDDSAVWASKWFYKECSNADVKKLGVPDLANRLLGRLLGRLLYKCVDVGVRDKPGGNLFNRFRSKLDQAEPGRRNGNEFLFDDATVASYKWYNFQAESAPNKVLIKTRKDMREPEDILNASEVVKLLREDKRIQRVYAPDAARAKKLKKILEEVE